MTTTNVTELVSEDEIRKVRDYLRTEASGYADSLGPCQGYAYTDAANQLDQCRDSAKALDLLKQDEEYAAGQLQSFKARLARIQSHRVVLERLIVEARKADSD